MTTYSRYMVRMVTRPMVATILIALIALLAERTLRVVDLVVGWRGSVLVVFEMLGYLVPHYMGLAIPAAFFLGVLLTFDRLSRESELGAIFAGGSSLVRLVRPLVAYAVFLMLLQTALASYLQPWGRYAYRAASWALTNASFSTLLQDGIFTTLNRTTYMVERISPDQTDLSRVFIFTQDGSGTTVAVTANSGTVDRPGPISPIALKLHDGLQQVVPAPPTPPETRASGQELLLRFRNFDTEFGTGANAPEPRGEDEREYTLPELYAALGNPRPGAGIKPSEISAEFYGRVVRILSLPLLPFLAIPLAVGHVRGQRSYGLVIGLAALIAYHQVLSLGESVIDNGKTSVALGLWAPFAVFALLALALFWRAHTTVPDPRGAPWLDRQLDRLIGLLRSARRRAVPARA